MKLQRPDPAACLSHHCGWEPKCSEAEYERGRKLFRDALAEQLHFLTGMEQSLVQKMNEQGRLQWVVEPLCA
ncbi:hypothetical protein FOA52_010991 [Chlamydomonas sp. UWO 241]|nr:hypothetical protein FOA52_010991 [Chlamydomonas sp. UWO 241]